MKKLMRLATILFVAFFSIIPIYAQDTYIDDMDIKCVIDQKGTATFTETWDMYAYEGTEGYKVFSNMHDMKINLISVTESGNKYKILDEWDIDASKSEKTNKAGINYTDDGYELCFGLGKYGHKKYTMTYTISHFIQQYEETQGINYAFMGDMELDVNNVTVDISSKAQEFTTDNSKIWGYGYEGRCDYLENGHIRMSTEGDINRVQLLSSIENSPYSAPGTYHKNEKFSDVESDAQDGASFDDSDDYDDGDDYYEDDDGIFGVVFSIFGFGIFAAVAAIFGIALSDGGESEKRTLFRDGSTFNKKEVRPFRDIPTKDILYFYYLADKAGLINDNNKGGLLSAYLLKWIRDKNVSFTKGEKTGFLFKKDTYEIDFRNEFYTENSIEEDARKYFIKASGKDHILQTKEFERWAEKNYTTVRAYFNRAKNYEQENIRTQGLLKVKRTKEKKFLFNRNVTQYIFDEKVKEDMEHVYGLYLFLKDQNNMKEKEAIEVHLWDEYLMFASILGIADTVQKQLNIVCPEYQEMYYDYYTSYYISNMFIRNAVSRSEQAYHTANSGSASTGGGGFSSFGGGGGGFSGGGGGGVR